MSNDTSRRQFVIGAGALAATAAIGSTATMAAQLSASQDRPTRRELSARGLPDRRWLGAELWANPMEDWAVRGERFELTHTGGHRCVNVLTAELTEAAEPFQVRVTMQRQGDDDRGWLGVQLGVQGNFSDYRDSAIHGVGLAVGVSGGKLFVGMPGEGPATSVPTDQPFDLTVKGEPAGEMFKLTVSLAPVGKRDGDAIVVDGIDPSWLVGLIGVVVSSRPPVPNDATIEPSKLRPARLPNPPTQRGGNLRAAIDSIELGGAKFAFDAARAFGPILWTTYTLDNDGTLRLLAQLAEAVAPEATLQVGDRRVVAPIDPMSRTAQFEVAGLDTTASHIFAVQVNDGTFFGPWGGTVRPIPTGRNVRVAAMSCNDATGFPHNDLVKNVAAHEPDLIAFLGDQIYEGIGGYGLVSSIDGGDVDRATVSYLRKYFMHGWTWRELLRNRPSFAIPDDHDVFHGNIWGDGGRATEQGLRGGAAQDSGGYKEQPAVVNVVHRTQTGSLPRPVDPTPLDSGISVYFTRWKYGPLDMVILADRMWKSPPKKLLPDAQINNGWPQAEDWTPPRSAEGAEMLGPRQEAFLELWAGDRDEASPQRIVFSQTPFHAMQTLPAGSKSGSIIPGLPVYEPGDWAPDDRTVVEFDANGWPMDKRDLALRLMRQAGAIHIAGDQHLGTSGQYGIDDYADGPFWLATPAIANLWPRRWMPRDKNGKPNPTGAHTDGFGNKMTVHSVANPVQTGKKPARLYDRAVGYVVATFRDGGDVEFAIWPYTAGPDGEPFAGWPVTVTPVVGGG